MSGEFLCLQAFQKFIHIAMNGDLELACIAGGARKNGAREGDTQGESVSLARPVLSLAPITSKRLNEYFSLQV